MVIGISWTLHLLYSHPYTQKPWNEWASRGPKTLKVVKLTEIKNQFATTIVIEAKLTTAQVPSATGEYFMILCLVIGTSSHFI